MHGVLLTDYANVYPEKEIKYIYVYMYVCIYMYVYIHIYASWSNGVQVHMNHHYTYIYSRMIPWLYTYSLTYESMIIHIFTPENSIVIHIFTHGD